MDSFKHWALCLIVGTLAGTIITVLSPRGAATKTVRTVVGIFIVSVIGMPFADMIKNTDISEAFAVYDYVSEGEDMREFMLESFCESVKKELENAASQMGIPLEEAIVEADIDDDNCIIIHNISVKIDSEFSDKAAELSDFLSENTGVYITVIAE